MIWEDFLPIFASVQKAFILGAGLGTRLGMLTERLPKPLLPIFGKPLITFIFDHLQSIGIDEFIVNTHHCAEKYEETFPQKKYKGWPLFFRHEPSLLDTGGGIANVQDLLGKETFIVYNGDILTDLPLEKAVQRHKESDNLVTLILRSKGPQLHVGFDENTQKVVEIQSQPRAEKAFQFASLYLVEPEIFTWLTPGEKHSILPPLREMIKKENKVGGIVIDEGVWWNMDSRLTYVEAHQMLQSTHFPSYAPRKQFSNRHSQAVIDDSVEIDASSYVGEGAVIEAGVKLTNTLVWPKARVQEGSQLTQCIVRSGKIAKGILQNKDV